MHLVKESIISLDAERKCYPDTGSIGNRLEEQYTKEILEKLNCSFGEKGYKVIDCTSWEKEFYFVGDSLSHRVKEINRVNSTLHLAFLLEKREKNYIECWVNNYGKAFKFAKKISENLFSLADYNNYVKLGENYLLENCTMPVIIIKIFFNDYEDFQLKAIDTIVDKISKSIIE